MEVINGKKDGFLGEDTIYIGRANTTYGLDASPLANPYPINKTTTRADSIHRYKMWLYNVYATKEGEAYRELISLVNMYKAGIHVKLACWCKPQACHGDVIKQVVEFLGDYDGAC